MRTDRSRGNRTGEDDRYGFEETTSYLSKALGSLVPRPLARRAITVRIRTDRDRYEPGEPVEITIEFRNRLPVPVTVETPRQRLWGWTVDGELSASDEPRYASATPAALGFRPRERKQIVRTWNGRFKRVGERADGATAEWVPAEPREYEIRAFLATEDRQPADATTIRIGSSSSRK
jgi:hypothetical protein